MGIRSQPPMLLLLASDGSDAAAAPPPAVNKKKLTLLRVRKHSPASYATSVRCEEQVRTQAMEGGRGRAVGLVKRGAQRLEKTDNSSGSGQELCFIAPKWICLSLYRWDGVHEQHSLHVEGPSRRGLSLH